MKPNLPGLSSPVCPAKSSPDTGTILKVLEGANSQSGKGCWALLSACTVYDYNVKKIIVIDT